MSSRSPVAPAGFSTDLTDDQLAGLERRFLAAWNDPKEWRRCRRENLRRNLTRRARVRLALTQLNIKAGIWLVDRGQTRAAARLWRIKGVR